MVCIRVEPIPTRWFLQKECLLQMSRYERSAFLKPNDFLRQQQLLCSERHMPTSCPYFVAQKYVGVAPFLPHEFMKRDRRAPARVAAKLG